MDRSNITFHSDNFNYILNDNTKSHVSDERTHAKPSISLHKQEMEYELLYNAIKKIFTLHTRSKTSVRDYNDNLLT